MIDPAELSAWLRLLETPGASRAAIRRLLAAFGGPQAVLDVPAAARRARVDADYADALSVVPADHEARLAATCAWLQSAPPDAPRHVVTLGDPAYPPLLLHTADPPLLLHAIGDLARLAAPSVAIVGSRAASAQGREHARQFARQLSQRGLTVVSGLALGIDGAAHVGALEGPGRTIAVVGTGLDVAYPTRHAALAERIGREGLLISEYSLGTPPLPFHFPQRNRLIAGLALGTLVVEATVQSGSLITARLAAEMGREVFAVPGSIRAEQAQGCHELIRQGARLVETVDDILEELGPPWAPPPRRVPAGGAPVAVPPARPSGPPDPVLDAMGHDPIDLDTLSDRTGFGAAELGARLLELELQGRVERLPGGRLQRRSRA